MRPFHPLPPLKNREYSIPAITLAIAWAVLFLAYGCGFRYGYLIPWMIAVSGCFLLTDRWTQLRTSGFLSLLETHLPLGLVIAFVTITSGSVLVSNELDLASFRSNIWDLGTYIQAAYTQAFQDHPRVTFPGQLSSIYDYHFSASIPVLGWIYKLFGGKSAVVAWQWLFFMAPGMITLLFYRAVLQSKVLKPTALGYLLSYCCFLLNPVFSGQMYWAYVLHIAGPAFLALAYLFYFKRNWAAWFFCMILFALQKEEFGVMATSFGLFVAVESIWKNGTSKKHLWPPALGALVAIVGLGEYVWFTRSSKQLIAFSMRFGNLGNSPSAALWTIISHPGSVFQSFLQPTVRSYLLFFLAGSLLWLRPRLAALKYAVPMLPFLFLFCLSDYERMHLLKDHYVLPLMVALLATLILGVLNTLSVQEIQRGRIYHYLGLAILIFMCFDYPNPLLDLRHKYRYFEEQRKERQALAWLQERKNILVCCEDRICAAFSDRPYLLTLQACLKGAPLLTQLKGKEAVILATPQWLDLPSNADLAKSKTAGGIRFPDAWDFSTPTIQVSSIFHIGG